MSKKPNLLIIHTDQQNQWTLSAYGGKTVNTPNIDSIGQEGAIFSHFFTNSAVCTPSRGCFITGRYPHCNGAYTNDIELNRDQTTLAHVLSQNGYDTGYIGKWHLDGPDKPGWVNPARSMGFEDSRLMFNRGHWKSIFEKTEEERPVLSEDMGDENTYTTDWLTTKAIDFMGRKRNNPFFLMLSIPDPHGPVDVRPPYDKMYNPEDMPLSETFYEENTLSWVKETWKNKKERISEQKIRGKMAQYCGEVKCIDYNTGKILDFMSEHGMLDDTVIVYTTDHGDYWGEHGIRTSKNQLYETVYRIPLLIRWPKKIKKGTVVNRVFSTVDFQRTILGLMDIEPCGAEQGRDGSPVLQGEDIEWKDEAFIHHSSLKRAGIFTPEYELAVLKEGDHILFDRINDPLQINNLFNRPEYRDIVRNLTKRVIEHNRKFDSPALKWLTELKQAWNL